MTLKNFKGPVTNDKTAVFLKHTGVSASANLVGSIHAAADDDARWTAVTSWAGNDDANVTRLPAAITELPDFNAPPNRQNVEVFDGNNQTVQVLGIATTPDLDLTITLFDPGNDSDHADLAALDDGTMMDVLVLTATTWKKTTTKFLNPAAGNSALEASGFAALVTVGRPYTPGGAASDYARLTIPMAYRDSERIVASY